eukprot:SAG31_NODE_1202_length_9417_cov_17.778064_2_plen_202_part_00
MAKTSDCTGGRQQSDNGYAQSNHAAIAFLPLGAWSKRRLSTLGRVGTEGTPDGRRMCKTAGCALPQLQENSPMELRRRHTSDAPSTQAGFARCGHGLVWIAPATVAAGRTAQCLRISQNISECAVGEGMMGAQPEPPCPAMVCLKHRTDCAPRRDGALQPPHPQSNREGSRPGSASNLLDHRARNLRARGISCCTITHQSY